MHILSILIISNTHLKGEILHASFFNFSTFYVFSVSNNTFSGTISETICQFRVESGLDVITVDLSNNNFMGTIPSCLFDIFFRRDTDLIYDELVCIKYTRYI